MNQHFATPPEWGNVWLAIGFGDTGAVATRERALAVDDLAEGGGDVVEVVVVERDDAGARLEREHRRLDLGRGQHLPEPRLLADGFHGSNQLRIEPAAAATASVTLRLTPAKAIAPGIGLARRLARDMTTP